MVAESVDQVVVEGRFEKLQEQKASQVLVALHSELAWEEIGMAYQESVALSEQLMFAVKSSSAWAVL